MEFFSINYHESWKNHLRFPPIFGLEIIQMERKIADH